MKRLKAQHSQRLMMLTSQTPRNRRSLSYRDNLVAYIDVLGFSELIANQHPNEISRLLRLVQESAGPIKGWSKGPERYRYFADLIVIATPIEDSICLFHEIYSLALSQVQLVDNKILVRGALTIGGIEDSYGVMFGPGLVKAYKLEQEIARFPRIVVDPDLLVRFKKDSKLRCSHHTMEEELKDLRHLIAVDETGTPYIDYLYSVRGDDEFIPFMKRHKELILHGLARKGSDSSIRHKLMWLKHYHNRTAKRVLEDEDCAELCISPEGPL